MANQPEVAAAPALAAWQIEADYSNCRSQLSGDESAAPSIDPTDKWVSREISSREWRGDENSIIFPPLISEVLYSGSVVSYSSFPFPWRAQSLDELDMA